jgi:hypothetical protein
LIDPPSLSKLRRGRPGFFKNYAVASRFFGLLEMDLRVKWGGIINHGFQRLTRIICFDGDCEGEKTEKLKLKSKNQNLTPAKNKQGQEFKTDSRLYGEKQPQKGTKGTKKSDTD